DHKRKPRDKSQWCFGEAVHQPGHGVKLPFPEKKHITTTSKKCIDATQQVGKCWRRRAGSKRGRREAEDANRRSDGLSQFVAKLLDGCSHHLAVDLRMSVINVAEVSRREYNSSFVQELGRGAWFVFGREPDSFGESRVHQVRQESLVIPSGEGWPAKFHKVDFNSVPDDIL